MVRCQCATGNVIGAVIIAGAFCVGAWLDPSSPADGDGASTSLSTDVGGTAADMVAAAQSWLATLSDDQRKQGQLAIDDPAQKDWHFVPRRRPGIALADLSIAGRRAVHRLLRSALSSQGYLKATSIMALERVLCELEASRMHVPPRKSIRDSENYSLIVFGNPSTETPWAWRFEGHHLSLSFVVSKDGVTTTPSFYGSNPAEVTSGESAGLRVLAEEEDGGWRLALSLDAERRKLALINERAPRDVILQPGRDAIEAQGIEYRALSAAQRTMLFALIGEYAHNLKSGLAERELARIKAGGLDTIRFAWAGPISPDLSVAGKRPRYYYRIQGPTFVIECDCTQADPHHIHTVWRDPEHDLGRNLLKSHHEMHFHR